MLPIRWIYHNRLINKRRAHVTKTYNKMLSEQDCLIVSTTTCKNSNNKMICNIPVWLNIYQISDFLVVLFWAKWLNTWPGVSRSKNSIQTRTACLLTEFAKDISYINAIASLGAQMCSADFNSISAQKRIQMHTIACISAQNCAINMLCTHLLGSYTQMCTIRTIVYTCPICTF